MFAGHESLDSIRSGLNLAMGHGGLPLLEPTKGLADLCMRLPPRCLGGGGGGR